MKIVPISKTNYDKNYQTKNDSLPKTNLKAQEDNVSFGMSPKKGLSLAFDWIDKNGFFVEFLIVDALSMILPRIAIGLNRDRDKTGKINYKAGAEEAGREVISGPSMFLIPMAILEGYKRFNPSSQMNTDTLSALNRNIEKIATSDALVNKSQLQTDLAGQLFDDAFADLELADRKGLKETFVKLLNKSTESSPMFFFMKWFKGKDADKFSKDANAFAQHVAYIYNQDKKAVHDDVRPILLTLQEAEIRMEKGEEISKAKSTASELFGDFHSYCKDTLEKLTKQNITENVEKELKDFLEKVKVKSSNLKLLTGLTGFAAVGVFLLYLPKLYQQGKVSPMQESANRASGTAIAQGGKNANS